jgi:hypothetical protein
VRHAVELSLDRRVDLWVPVPVDQSDETPSM